MWYKKLNSRYKVLNCNENNVLPKIGLIFYAKYLFNFNSFIYFFYFNYILSEYISKMYIFGFQTIVLFKHLY